MSTLIMVILLPSSVRWVGTVLSRAGAAAKRGDRVISSMGAAARTDPSQVYSTHLWKTHNCPLAAKVRQGLRRRGIKTKIPVVYPVVFYERISGYHR